jgi:hypothetical protein
MRVLVVAFLFSAVATAVNTPVQFAGRRDYSGGGLVVGVGDVNGDKIPDVVKIGYANAVTSLLGTGSGTFNVGPTSHVGLGFIEGLAVTDLNGDGFADLAVSGTVLEGESQGGVGIAYGIGDGSFQQAVFYPCGGDMAFGNIVFADFNGDGIPDLAVAGESGVWLLTGKGGGVF